MEKNHDENKEIIEIPNSIIFNKIEKELFERFKNFLQTFSASSEYEKAHYDHTYSGDITLRQTYNFIKKKLSYALILKGNINDYEKSKLVKLATSEN